MTADTAQPLSKQQLRTQRSTDSLLRAASELLVEEGVNALTLVKVGERAGFSRGLVTSRFGSKDSMIQALVERMSTNWAVTHLGPRIAGRPGREALLELLRGMRDQTERRPSNVLALQALLFDALNPVSSARPSILEYNASLHETMEALLATGIADQTIRPDLDPSREASWLLESLRGIGFHWLLTPDEYDVIAALTHLIEVVEDRFTPR